jgi:hypothetical protein
VWNQDVEKITNIIIKNMREKKKMENGKMKCLLISVSSLCVLVGWSDFSPEKGRFDMCV